MGCFLWLEAACCVACSRERYEEKERKESSAEDERAGGRARSARIAPRGWLPPALVVAQRCNARLAKRRAGTHRLLQLAPLLLLLPEPLALPSARRSAQAKATTTTTSTAPGFAEPRRQRRLVGSASRRRARTAQAQEANRVANLLSSRVCGASKAQTRAARVVQTLASLSSRLNRDLAHSFSFSLAQQTSTLRRRRATLRQHTHIAHTTTHTNQQEGTQASKQATQRAQTRPFNSASTDKIQISSRKRKLAHQARLPLILSSKIFITISLYYKYYPADASVAS